jgi:hypothetical protein
MRTSQRYVYDKNGDRMQAIFGAARVCFRGTIKH